MNCIQSGHTKLSTVHSMSKRGHSSEESLYTHLCNVVVWIRPQQISPDHISFIIFFWQSHTSLGSLQDSGVGVQSEALSLCLCSSVQAQWFGYEWEGNYWRSEDHSLQKWQYGVRHVSSSQALYSGERARAHTHTHTYTWQIRCSRKSHIKHKTI